MIALLGALAFGVVATGAWISAESQERKDYNYSKTNHLDTYVDKKGKTRYTTTRKKYTTSDSKNHLKEEEYRSAMEKYNIYLRFIEEENKDCIKKTKIPMTFKEWYKKNYGIDYIL